MSRGGASPGAATRRPQALRWLGAAALAAGLAAAARWHPESAPPWRVVERFGIDRAACEQRLAARRTAPFTLPADHPAPEPLPEVARWFHLDPAAVCTANRIPAGECLRHRVEPGDSLELPLGRGAAAAAAPEG